jgi:hypothetical protein
MSSRECKNCNSVFDGNFCPQCGQASNTHRINASYFLHDIPHSVFHVDKGFPYTFIQLIRRPARALDEYLAGRRVRYFRPLGYVLIMSAICALIVSRIRIYMQELQQHLGNFSYFFFITVSGCFYLLNDTISWRHHLAGLPQK